MTKEEMIARAVGMRSRDLYGQVKEEELAALSAVQEVIQVSISTGDGPESGDSEDRKIKVYQITEKNRLSRSPMVINFHGGGFIKGRQDKDRVFSSRLAERFQALVWDVDYSLAPENPFPKAVHEAYDIVKYAFDHGKELDIDTERVVLIGHSAGGNLAITVCMKAGETRAFKPAGLIAEFFPADLYTDPAEKKRVEGDMPAEVAKTYNAFYCAGETAKDPYASPIFASEEQLKAFPETLIISGGLDSLCYEDEEFAMKLSRAGVTVTSRRFVSSHHGFTINRADEWKESQKLIEEFMNRLV